MNDIFLRLFGRKFENNELNYKTVLDQIFGKDLNNLPKKTPTFRTEESIEEILSSSNQLSEKGIFSLRRILFIIQKTCPYITYCPLLVHVLHIFLIFLTESETYFCVLEMLEISKNTFKTMNIGKTLNRFKYLWYFHLSVEDFEK